MSIYDSLNKMQQAATFHTDGPLLILAGAGSGKTRVLTHRIVYLIEEVGVNPYNILAITFTNKAAGEMRERVDQLVGFGSEAIWVSTFHSMCVRILRRYIDRLGYETNFTIYDSDDSKTLMKDVCKRLNIDTKMLREKFILGEISRAKDELWSPEKMRERSAGDFQGAQIARCYREYQEELKRNNALDFDDLIVKTIELFKKEPEVLNYYQERFQYIMVDEYQDTNTAQFELISLLAKKYQNLCVVGDDDQSIYKFRGANIKNILNFEQVFPNTRTIKLEQNYRSTKRILQAANSVIANNVGRKDKALWTENDEGDKVRFLQFDSAYDEADYIAHNIKEEVMDQGNYTYSDIACLYRTNAQSRLLEERLMFLSVPYKIVGGVNFYQRKEIKDLLAYLKTVDSGNDEIAVRRILNVPRRGIGATSISKISDYAAQQRITFFEALSSAGDAGAPRAQGKIDGFIEMIHDFRKEQEFLSLHELATDILEKTGYLAALRDEKTDEARDRIANIEELINKIVDYENNVDEEEPTLSGFLEEVALISDLDRLNEEDDYVTLMTVHAAKGLEFPQVYLSGMEDGLFPSYMSITSGDESDVEEERRLCYVAITRAMESLTVSCAKSRMVNGEWRNSNISRFVLEIDPEVVDASGRGMALHRRQVLEEDPLSSSAKAAFSRKPGNYTKQASFEHREKPADFLASMGVQKGMSSVNNLEEGLSYQVGDRVKHIKFGQGLVTEIKKMPKDYQVTVEFDQVGVRKLFAAFAKLKKI